MDPTADMLIAIKNAYMAKKPEVVVPISKFTLAIVTVLEKEKFVGKVEKKDRSLKIQLLYENDKPKITQIEKISKSGLRIYSKSKNIKNIKGGRGMLIISTPSGVMTGYEAKKKKLGGEVICKVW